VQHEQRQRSIGCRARQAAGMDDHVEFRRARQDDLDRGLVRPGEIAVGSGLEQRINPSRIIGGSSKTSPAEVERDDLGKVTVTVLEWQYSALSLIAVYGQSCNPSH